MTTPNDIFNAWELATDEAANLIADAAGMNRGSKGNFFLDHFPPVYDAGALFLSGGTDNAPWLGDNPPRTMNLDFRIEGRFRLREDARKFATNIMGSLPIKSKGNIKVMQPITVPSIEGRYFKLRNAEDAQLLFAVDVTGRCVFSVT